MNALVNALLAAENEAKWLRHEKLDAKLEAVKALQQRLEFANHKQAVESAVTEINELRQRKVTRTTHTAKPWKPSTN